MTAKIPSSPTAIMPYNTKELAQLYGVSRKVWDSWIKPFKDKIGKRRGYTYTTLQVELIFSLLGPPLKELED